MPVKPLASLGEIPMEPTIFGVPQSMVVNQLQNVALVVLTFFASRAHLSSDFVGQWAGIVGAVITMAANAFAVQPTKGNGNGAPTSTGLPNGPTVRT